MKGRGGLVALVGTGIARIDMVIIDMATAHARSIVARQAKTKRQRDCQISNQRTFQNGTQKIFQVFTSSSVYGTRNTDIGK